MLMSVESEDSCDDFVSMPWTVAMSCPLTSDQGEAGEPPSRDRVAPGVELFGAGEISSSFEDDANGSTGQPMATIADDGMTSDMTMMEMEASVYVLVTPGNNSNPKAQRSEGNEYPANVAAMPDISASTAADNAVKPTAGLRESVVTDAESVA